jgi:hypothetical protein
LLVGRATVVIWRASSVPSAWSFSPTALVTAGPVTNAPTVVSDDDPPVALLPSSVGS